MKTITLSVSQINQVNSTIQSYHTSKFTRLSPMSITKSQTNLIFDDMKITQDTQVLAILDTLDIVTEIGDCITI